MNKLWVVLGGLFLVLIAVLGVLFGVSVVSGPSLDDESRAYVEDALPKIFSDFSAESLLRFGTDEDRKMVNREVMDGYAQQMRRQLGKYKSYEDLKGDAIIHRVVGETWGDYGHYGAKVIFEKGTLPVKISLEKKENAWAIRGIAFGKPELKAVPEKAPAQQPAGGK